MQSESHTGLFAAILHTPFGGVGIRTQDAVISEIVYLPLTYPEKPPANDLAARAVQQIQSYINDPDFRFDLPLLKVGTQFQNNVWGVISSIERGDVMTYGAVAKQIKSAPRAVGQACGANWYPLVIPCHRVTAAGGIGGFAHHDADSAFYSGVKRWLLAHEGVSGYTV